MHSNSMYSISMHNSVRRQMQPRTETAEGQRLKRRTTEAAHDRSNGGPKQAPERAMRQAPSTSAAEDQMTRTGVGEGSDPRGSDPRVSDLREAEQRGSDQGGPLRGSEVKEAEPMGCEPRGPIEAAACRAEWLDQADRQTTEHSDDPTTWGGRRPEQSRTKSGREAKRARATGPRIRSART